MISIFIVSVGTSGTSWLVGVTLHYIALIDPDFPFAEQLFNISSLLALLRDRICVFSNRNRRGETVVDPARFHLFGLENIEGY